MLRRSFVMVLALVVATSLVGCGGDGAGASNEDRDASDRTSSTVAPEAPEKAASSSTSTTGPAASTTTSSSATSVTTGTTVTTAPSGGGDRLQAALQYVRSGGLAGITFELMIQPDGGAVMTGSTPFLLSEAELDAVVADLDASGFTGLEAQYTDPQVADAFTHTITYAGHSVSATETVVPPALQPLLQTLQDIIAAH